VTPRPKGFALRYTSGFT